MPIIPGIQICIPSTTQHANAVIVSMERLLEQRRTGRISRRAFLVAWAKKRKALFLTRDYQELRQRVCREAGGQCEVCNERTGEHMHHNLPVAIEPRKALERTNVVWVCVSCHEDEDVAAQQRVVADRERTKKRAAKYLGATQAFNRDALAAQLGTQEDAESRPAKRAIQSPRTS